MAIYYSIADHRSPERGRLGTFSGFVTELYGFCLKVLHILRVGAIHTYDVLSMYFVMISILLLTLHATLLAAMYQGCQVHHLSMSEITYRHE